VDASGVLLLGDIVEADMQQITAGASERSGGHLALLVHRSSS
jgi:hypothetical protein